MVNVGGQKVYPAEVESILMQMDNVRDVSVHAEPNVITGQMVVAVVQLDEPEDPLALSRRMRVFCRDRLARYKMPARVVVAQDGLVSPRYKKLRRGAP